MSNGSPLVSIVIPAYNVDRYLKQCLDSVARQTVDAIEVICVDDGSTDGSASIIDAFADKDSRFVAIHQPNGGYGKAVNTGLSLAKGSYVGIVESDDFIDESMFEMLFSAARRHGFPDVVKAAYWRVCNPDTPEQQMIPAYYYHRVSHVDEPFTLSDDAELLFHHPSIWSAIYRRDFLQARDIRMREEPGAAWVDNPFLMETLVQANAIVYLDQPLYYYREFSIGSSSSVKDPSIVYERWLEMDDILRSLKVATPCILEGHYNRGCAYIEMLDEQFGRRSKETAYGIARMVDRIDYGFVRESSKILKEYKRALRHHVPFLERVRSRILGYRCGGMK